jgi:hypothetical protein
MQVKQVLKWAGIGFVVFFLFTRPNDAANTTENVVNGIRKGADSMAQFVSHMSS